MIEVKKSDASISQHLHYFNGKCGFRGIQIVADLHTENESGEVHLRRAADFLTNLTLP